MYRAVLSLLELTLLVCVSAKLLRCESPHLTLCAAEDIHVPASPMFQPDGDPETVSQKNASLDVNGFPRIAGLSSEQHTFTADIAFSQVLLDPTLSTHLWSL